MINIDKINTYSCYDGEVDGLGHGPKRDRKIISEDEFILIGNLIQDIRLIQKNIASPSYEEQVNKKLKEICDGDETIFYLKALAAKFK